MIGSELEPAPGRVLVTADRCIWLIESVSSRGRLWMRDPFNKENVIVTKFYPDLGEWIGPDLTTVLAWAKLTGRELS